MSRFTAYNTDYQYNNSELAELNAAFDQIAADAKQCDSPDLGDLSLQDYWAETLLEQFAMGKTGSDLVAWFYRTGGR
jgi:hypothetical protein